MGNIFTPESVVALIGIIGTVISGLLYVAKRNVDVKLAASEMAKKKAEAESEALRNDSQARLKKTEGEVASEATLLTMFQQQVTINKQNADLQAAWLKALQDKEERDERNYKVLKGLQDSNTQTLMTEIRNQSKNIKTAIQLIPAIVQKASLDVVNTVATEMAIKIVEQMAIQSIKSEFLRFPFPDDPGWEDVMLLAIKEDVMLKKSPQYGDEVTLPAPKGKTYTHPFAARIIRNRIPGWWIVEKKQNGDPPGYGYVEERWVKISEQAAIPA